MKESQYHFSFEELEVYQKAIAFGELVDSQIKKFPKQELFHLSLQFARAADSIALNIAEGSAYKNQNFNKHLRIAKGSCLECVAVSTKARIRNYINKEENELNRKYLTEINKMISGLLKYLENKGSS